jgi:hypothetical protein
MNSSGRQSMGTRQHVDPERPVHALTGPVSRRIYTEPVAVASSPGRGLLEGASVRVREVMSRGRATRGCPPPEGVAAYPVLVVIRTGEPTLGPMGEAWLPEQERRIVGR